MASRICLDAAKYLANKYHLSVCADRWFGRMRWLETWCVSTFFAAGMKSEVSVGTIGMSKYTRNPFIYQEGQAWRSSSSQCTIWGNL
ncbi:hypothetical protein PROFUN_15145 [Planoprotostelium fungivorum]|uniref:Uncharacterized protein n=1 Tax=Planoprotostelium fungivorum TaxID=1890364 RepID=A0A2P6MXT5_9EUKA|nr:hypothetical protein PROFUN_15145 [Planoprotostelium fungivorum]